MGRARHRETHRTDRIGWLRAAVLGANDGIVSTASLVMGVAGAEQGRAELLVAGIAGLVAGAMSMAAGEFVSVSSQSDTERAELEIEKRELEVQPELEREELASIYVSRGLSRELAGQVAEQLMAHDALGAHARDELGMTDTSAARPVTAALASAGSFAVGAALPLLATWLAPASLITALVMGSSLVCLAGLGAVAARTGRAPVARAASRVVLLGALAMGVTYGVGRVFGVMTP